MNRTRFIQGLNSNIELSDKERRRAIRNSINKRPWKLNCTIAMEEFAELTQQVSKQIRGYGDRIGLIEEMADAYICLKLLESIFNISPEDEERFHKLLNTIFTICELAGFHIEGRIAIKDCKTGKIWR